MARKGSIEEKLETTAKELLDRALELSKYDDEERVQNCIAFAQMACRLVEVLANWQRHMEV